MALILCVETSSKNCSVSISREGVVIYTIEEIKDWYKMDNEQKILIMRRLSKKKINKQL